MNDDKKPLEHNAITSSGYLDVGDGHEIYWIDWGNLKSENIIFYLHGGPGGGISESDFDKFDPEKHRVIFHDQRGSSRSRPFASIEKNETANLVEDIEKLRNHLEINKISLCGFSWGSTVALAYAIAHPNNVEKMLIGGIFLAREKDNDFYLGGGVASHFPEVWAEFSDMVPKDANEPVALYYKRMLLGEETNERSAFANAWLKYEAKLAFLDYNPKKIERELNDFASESLAYLEAHYLLNNCFMEENYILENAHTLNDIDVVIVHGRYDFICMPSAAIELQQAIGDSAKLHVLQAGHVRSETVAREVVEAYTTMLWS
jgi:proline iminopeptidase